MSIRCEIIGLSYPSFYIKDYAKAIAFYTNVFGPPKSDEESIKGWQLGDTWLTLFPSKDGPEPDSNPRNAEFAIQVATPEEVDHLYQALIDAGAKGGWMPEDAQMYEPMRFSYVDDPFGIRLDIYCPLPPAED